MRLTLLALLVVTALSAQTAPPERQRFEVASVRIAAPPNTSGGPILRTEADMKQGGPGSSDPERISYRSVGLPYLIAQGFSLRQLQLGLPDQFKFRRSYDIAANIPAGATKEQFNTMLQNLLADRFGMRFHREPKQFDSYKLVIAAGGPKLKDTTIKTGDPRQSSHQDPDGSVFASGFGLISPRDGRLVFSGGKMTTGHLANSLERDLGGPVVDATGLTGEYDIRLEYSPEGLNLPPATLAALGNSASSPAPNIFQALERQLGLKLEKSKVTLDVLVVDHLNDVPTDN